MTGAIIILLVTIAGGLVLYVYDLKYRKAHPEEEGKAAGETETPHNPELCCGRHLICEKTLTPDPGEKPVYFDDEELDRFAGRGADDYAEEEIEEIREVMMTLRREETEEWVRSIRLRDIELPTPLRDELFMLLDDTAET